MLPPLVNPTYTDDLPRYPLQLQLVRVTAATVPGPAGVAQAAGSSVLAPRLYVAFTEQLQTNSLLPRDREPCLADDVNGLGLSPGFYLGRLAGTWTSLPVYEIVGVIATGLVGPQGPAGSAGSITGQTVFYTLDTFSLTNNTWNVAGDTYNYGTSPSPVTINFSHGTWNFQFGSTINNQTTNTYSSTYVGTYQSGATSTYQSSSTTTYQSGSVITNSSTETFSSTYSATYQSGSTQTVSQGAETAYQSSGATGTAPGILSVPTQTVSGKPTWTPPGGTYPEVWVPGDKKEWLWDGSTFQPFSVSPVTTKGDLYGFSTTDDRLPVGADQLPLVADSAQALGLKYAALTVPGGGTGVATQTAFAVVCGGTTSTGNLQQVSGLGTSNQVLTSNGPGALPTWRDPAVQAVAFGGTPTLTGTPSVFRVKVLFSNVATAAATNTLTLFTLPAGGVLLAPLGRELVTTFSGGAISNYQFQLGTVATPGLYFGSWTVFTGQPTGTTSLLTANLPDNPGTVKVTAVTDGVHLLNTATQGEAWLWFLGALMS